MNDLFDLLAVLNRLESEFVLIGGFSAAAHGYPLPTDDLDIAPAADPLNLNRLAAALEEVDAAWAGQALRSAESLRVETRLGRLDVVFNPFGTGGYDDLRRDAVELTVWGEPVRAASLRDLIRIKDASSRPLDQAQLPALRRTLEVVRRRSDLEQ